MLGNSLPQKLLISELIPISKVKANPLEQQNRLFMMIFGKAFFFSSPSVLVFLRVCILGLFIDCNELLRALIKGDFCCNLFCGNGPPRSCTLLALTWATEGPHQAFG